MCFLKNDRIGNTVIKIIKYNRIEVEDGHYVSNILLLNNFFNAAFGIIILMFHCSLLSNQGIFGESFTYLLWEPVRFWTSVIAKITV